MNSFFNERVMAFERLSGPNFFFSRDEEDIFLQNLLLIFSLSFTTTFIRYNKQNLSF